MVNLRHPNITQVLGAVLEGAEPILVMEFMQARRLRECSHISFPHTVRRKRQLALVCRTCVALMSLGSFGAIRSAVRVHLRSYPERLRGAGGGIGEKTLRLCQALSEHRSSHPSLRRHGSQNRGQSCLIRM